MPGPSRRRVRIGKSRSVEALFMHHRKANKELLFVLEGAWVKASLSQRADKGTERELSTVDHDGLKGCDSTSR
jgi:hypothetical protein